MPDGVAATCETWTAMKVSDRCVRATVISAVGLLIVAVVGSCAETPRTATNFCRVLADRIGEMVEPPVDDDGVRRLIEHYTRLAEVAPLEVEDDIVTLRDLFIAASEVDTTDDASVQSLADLAYEAERAAEDAGIYVGATCGTDLSTGFAVEIPGN